jgi:hypothetical protein
MNEVSPSFALEPQASHYLRDRLKVGVRDEIQVVTLVFVLRINCHDRSTRKECANSCLPQLRTDDKPKLRRVVLEDTFIMAFRYGADEIVEENTSAPLHEV